MSAEALINVIVQLEHAPASDMQTIVANLAEHGFVLNQTLNEIGVLTGSVAITALATLATVPGVAAVERERGDYHTQA